MSIDPLTLLRPRRKITGLSAVLLPFTEAGTIDWAGFDRHLTRTAEAGLTPAVNMDTGYVNLLSSDERNAVLDRTQSVLGGGKFVAGAYVGDQPDAAFNPEAYVREIGAIQERGGVPVIFQSFGLVAQGDVVSRYATLAKHCDQFIGFELGSMFAPFGKIYDLETYSGLMSLQACLGAKHSSLNRSLEWERLVLRDAQRPDFKVFTGNDLAIDLVMYGSDYLLGLSSFAPDIFARRDAWWEAGDPQFYELNDRLQYLGFLAFRPPVPAYKHSASQFLKLRGWLNSDTPHPQAIRRPESDVEILRDLADRLG